MSRKTAAISFLGTCAILAILLIIKVINPIVGGILFALALLVFGLLSRGFRR